MTKTLLALFASLIFSASSLNAQSVLPADIDSVEFFDYFKQKGIEISEATVMPLYIEVFRWLNTKYRYGSSSEAATDCSGFAGMLYKKVFGKELARSSRGIFPTCDEVHEKDQLKEGDLLFFKIKKGIISHVAVFLQNGKFAHAAVHGGVRIDSLDAPYYKRTFFKGGRFKLFSAENE
jgi:probable lipoprotein NlpC